MQTLRLCLTLVVFCLSLGVARADGESTWSWELTHVEFATWSHNSTTNLLTFTYPASWTLEDVHLSIDGSRFMTVVPGTPFVFVRTSIASGHRADIVAKKVLADGSRQWIITPIISRFCDDFLAPYRSPHDEACTDPFPEPNDSINPINDCDGEGQNGLPVQVVCTGDSVTGGTDDTGAWCESETTVTTPSGGTLTTTQKRRENCGTVQVENPDEPAPPSP